ncbi:hypothetical protein [Gallaecimonas pentaromativorans]|uniref:hypothetical protein n=1 Tax=Gallaecimonas pentaromativorans TaxID=584787 RepID=UPI003A941D4A
MAAIKASLGLAALCLASQALGAELKDTLPQSLLYLQNVFHLPKGPYYQVLRRKSGSDSLILVGPDGNKFYRDRHPDTVDWYSAPGMDIVRMASARPGPWQAIGEFTGRYPFKGFTFGAPAWPNPRYVGEQTELCQQIAEPAGSLSAAEFTRLVDARTWFTSSHVGKDDNFAFGSTAKVHLKGQGGRYCATLNVPTLAGHYQWSLRDSAVFDSQEFTQELLLKPLPLTIDTPLPQDDLSPLIYRATLNDDTLDPQSVRIALTLHLANNQQVKRILRPVNGVAELRYLQTPGHAITVSGKVDFIDAEGTARELQLPERTLVSVPPPKPKPPVDPQAEAAKPAANSGFSAWWLLFALVPVIFGTLWWWLRARKRQEALPTEEAQLPESQPQTPENDGFLLDLSRPDDVDEKN